MTHSHLLVSLAPPWSRHFLTTAPEESGSRMLAFTNALADSGHARTTLRVTRIFTLRKVTSSTMEALSLVWIPHPAMPTAGKSIVAGVTTRQTQVRGRSQQTGLSADGILFTGKALCHLHVGILLNKPRISALKCLPTARTQHRFGPTAQI